MADGYLKQFLETAPLYSKKKIDCWWFKYDDPSKYVAEYVDYFCPVCKRSRPFQVSPKNCRAAARGAEPDQYIYLYAAICAACGSWFTSLIEYSTKEKQEWVRKVGQSPAWDIALASDISEALGEADAALYRRARILLSQNYGLGACAYMRRILEHQINPLLKMLREIKAADSAAKPKELSEIDLVIAGRDASEKARLAYQIAPKSLVVEGQNPFKAIFDSLGDAIHQATEDEATAEAARLSASLDFVLRELAGHLKNRAEFVAAIKQKAK